MQVPLQEPFEQANGHACIVCQVPVASQVCAPPPAHCLPPGAQAPVHAPPRHK
jgi:hypothetical protein